MDTPSFGSSDKYIPISSECSVQYDYDSLFEILMRINPSNLFNCILVSKDWLSVLSCPFFRTNYLDRWKNSIELVVGLLRYEQYQCTSPAPEIQLFPRTSILGRKIDMPDSSVGILISKSPKGGLLLFRGNIHHKRLFVWKPLSGRPPVELPPSFGETLTNANIISSDDCAEYKVVLGGRRNGISNVSVEVFCSRTWKWENSELTCSIPLHLCPISIVDKGGVVYWNAQHDGGIYKCLAAWDINGGSCRMNVIPKPPLPSCFHVTYGESPHPRGSLVAATCSHRHNINIWALGDKKAWNLVHSVRHVSIWANNLALLASLVEVRRPVGFSLISFVPGKSDSIYVGLEQQLFVYHFNTGKLEHVKYMYGNAPEIFSGLDNFHPLTFMDLGIWPSSPPALQIPRW